MPDIDSLIHGMCITIEQGPLALWYNHVIIHIAIGQKYVHIKTNVVIDIAI